ncbi:MAG: flippase-like domain-containing protein [Candidatus Fermentibacteraceae bacterium]|nr:flippase-like domain-containing protein [Candidatus Fermentibacteraceae bacterium]
MKKIVFNIIGLILTAAALYYLVDSFLKGTAEAGGFGNLLSFNPTLFIISFVLMILHLLAAAWSWMLVCSTAGARISFRQAFNIHFLAQVGKYIPGKVWGAVGKIGLSKKIGISAVRTGHALILESLFIIAGCLLASLPVIPMAAEKIGMGTTLSVLIVLAVAGVVIFTAHPGAFRKLLKMITSVTGKDIDIQDPGFASVLKLLPVYLLVFLLQGIAFVFLARSFGMNLPFFPGAFLLPTAVGIGFLAVFSPGGLGIREISLVWLIGIVLTGGEPGQASLVSIAARLWITLGEALAFVAALILWRGNKLVEKLPEDQD